VHVADGLDDGADHDLAAAEEHALAVGVDLGADADLDFLPKNEKTKLRNIGGQCYSHYIGDF
jgi:hypothetical protein